MNPTKVSIGPHEFKVIYDRGPLLEKLQQDHEDQYGYSDFDKLEIVIDDRCPPSRKKEVLLHEILHCIIWAYSILIPVEQQTEQHKVQTGANNEEETFIQRLTTPLMLCFLQNLTIFKWILEKEKNHG